MCCSCITGDQVPVVQKVDNAIHLINLYPLDNVVILVESAIEQPGPVTLLILWHLVIYGKAACFVQARGAEVANLQWVFKKIY